ncbi:hypothetical protein HGG75_17690 [Ochrobactrum pseudogrignonense]|nr:hypothetical protein [Brucella pseudogrignonensis]
MIGRVIPVMREGRPSRRQGAAPWPSQRAIGPQTIRPGNGGARLISVGGQARLYSAKQISRALPSRPFAGLGLPDRIARGLSSP